MARSSNEKKTSLFAGEDGASINKNTAKIVCRVFIHIDLYRLIDGCLIFLVIGHVPCVIVIEKRSLLERLIVDAFIALFFVAYSRRFSW